MKTTIPIQMLGSRNNKKLSKHLDMEKGRLSGMYEEVGQVQKLTHYCVTLRIKLIYIKVICKHTPSLGDLEFLTSKLLLKPLNCPCYLLFSLHCCFCIKCKPQVVSPHSALLICIKQTSGISPTLRGQNILVQTTDCPLLKKK